MISQLPELQPPLPFRNIFAVAPMRDLSPKVLDALNDTELNELEGFRNLKRQREFATSRILLKQLAEQWNLPSTDLLIQKNELGNPFAHTPSGKYEVSIAHTEQAVFCGLSENEPIGIDMEPTGRKVSDRLHKRMMHPIEKKEGLQIEGIRMWTIKEAYIKLRGQGLRLNMNDVFIHKDGDDFTVKLNNDNKAKICSFQYQDNWLAIAFYL